MPPAQHLTHNDRAYRRERIIAAYIATERGGSRLVAERFGVSGSHVRHIVREAGVSKPMGRPRSDAHATRS
jgi:hypothetical protein